MSRAVVLVGAGHAHLYVAARAERFTRRGLRLILVEPGLFWYSGLATGVVGGLYEPARDSLDPEPLVRRAGGEFLRDRLIGLDGERARLASGRTLEYAALSLNIGSDAATEGLPGAEHALPVKPIEGLVRLREDLERLAGAAGGGPCTGGPEPAGGRAGSAAPPTAVPLRVLVIGAGASGCEVAANVAALARRLGLAARVAVAADDERLLRAHPAGAARALGRALDRAGVETRLGAKIVELGSGWARTASGERLSADILVLATGLAPPALIRRLGLPVGPDGGLRVDASLRAAGRDRIFGAGDCIFFEPRPLPKLGVFAVRQAPVLLANLLSAAEGRPLRSYRPQPVHLSILNLGDGTALATWGPFWWLGRASLRLKEWLDFRFLDRFSK